MKFQIIIWLLCFIFLSGCKMYHDTTAHYNAYFLAREKLTEVENALFTNSNDDYNTVLDIYTRIDTNTAKSQTEGLEYVIEKASLPIQKHKISKWVDDCYILIGKARLYKGDFRNAATTFKFVNTNSEDFEARHRALVGLMRVFVEMEDFENAEFVAQYLAADPIPISKANSRDFYLTLAHYYRVRQLYKPTAIYLEKALPYIKNRNTKLRTIYNIAQIWQKLGEDEKANQFYNDLLGRGPDYDMMFFARLNASKTIVFSKETADIFKKTKRETLKLLNDEKNAEFRDKIYYDLANLEYKQHNYDKSLEYLSESIYYSQGNQTQRALTYELFGKIYYEEKKNFKKAYLYYDSALQSIPKQMAEYNNIKKQTDFLKVFSKYYGEIKQADRLLRLMDFDEDERYAALENEIEREKAEIDKETARIEKRRKQERIQRPSLLTTSKAEGSSWYFYNQEAINTGKSYFFREWGNRPLADNWRRSDKESNPFSKKQSTNITEVTPEKTDSIPDKYASVKSLEERLKEIPSTSTQLKALHFRLQENLSALGKTYMELLQDNSKAKTYFSRLQTEYPRGKFTAEAIYNLLKICKLEQKSACDTISYIQQLVKNFPNSTYTKLAENKTVEQSKKTTAYGDNPEVNRLYQQSYAFYQSGNYTLAQQTLNQIITNYPQNKNSDKVFLLRAMVIGQIDNRSAYKSALQAFLREYQSSELLSFAQNLLAHLEKEKKQN